MRIKYLLMTIATLPNINFNAPVKIARIASHVRYSFDVDQTASIYVPFYANYVAELTYRIEVKRSDGVMTYAMDGLYHKFRAKSYFLVEQTLEPEQFSIGQNLFIINFQFDNNNHRIMYSYFFGYKAHNPIAINQGNDLTSSLGNITRYTFNEDSQSAVLNKMSFDNSAFSNDLFFKNDLFFDFEKLNSKVVYYEKTLSYSDVFLVFNDTGIFSKFPIINNKTHIPLSISLNNFIFSITPKLPLYVDPFTHMMSPHPEPGYIPTNKLFFPRNKFDILNHKHGQIIINDFITNKLNLVYNFRLDLNEPYIGKDGYYQIGIYRY